MWDHQNEALHNLPEYQADILDSWINEQVQTLFWQGTHAVPQDTFTLFQGPLADLLQKTKEYKEQWVQSVEAAILRKQHHEHGAYILEQCTICRWLGLDET